MATPNTTPTGNLWALDDFYDPAGSGLPSPAGFLIQNPMSSLHLPKTEWAYIAGMLERLLWADAWDADDDSEAQDNINRVLDVIDMIGRFDSVYTPYKQKWMTSNADFSLEAYSVLSGFYETFSNRIIGSWATGGYQYLNFTMPINSNLTGVEVTTGNQVSASTSRSGMIRLYLDEVLVSQYAHDGAGTFSMNYYGNGTLSAPRPFYVNTLRIDAWCEDLASSPGTSQVDIRELNIYGMGEYPFYTPF